MLLDGYRCIGGNNGIYDPAPTLSTVAMRRANATYDCFGFGGTGLDAATSISWNLFTLPHQGADLKTPRAYLPNLDINGVLGKQKFPFCLISIFVYLNEK